MIIHLAQHYGMCFGVRDALRATHSAASQEPVTILGQLVHNPVVDAHLATLGVRRGNLEKMDSSSTRRVIITAHGASDAHRQRWQQAGHQITDTSCPLVKKAHHALGALVEEGYHPVVIGQRQHVEVQGLIGDHPQASVLLTAEDACCIPAHSRLGVISQTTQPLDHVLRVVEAIKRHHHRSEVRFMDTVCRPTKQRQTALEDLAKTCDLIIVIGGRNSNNTRQLTEKARSLGVLAEQIETPDELRAEWFRQVAHVGVTAGTSTLDETVRAVMDRLQNISCQ
ncbi:4-hydroxy-3-methylbut-2-enyl diphosphate reductase [Prosthecobacter fusiformis]|uniref:4-hydroxy-3-methylbut-2-enyl diphosphate reductase n=1 Tax=Prosthecobacter fusiformis TaxID=48464 RepID=A0A4R7RXN3_9BACT|nr:4-hydroxy-3-methylbut-2-enyl diphosphate reductase [Prosthecobacter fusiformis]TDU70610.1 4-hydroxy-3-methylbut-2-enyl diphosphate reductase [Prosthecobacter fusiformis]